MFFKSFECRSNMAKFCFLEPFCLMRLGVRQGLSTAELKNQA